MKLAIITSTSLSLILLVISCKKKDKYDNSDAPRINAIVEGNFDDMTNMSDQAIKGNLIFYKSGQVIIGDGKEAMNYSKADCNVIVTLDTTGSTKTITIDWGTANCDCNDGKQRRGKIITTFTGSYYSPGTILTHTPVDYFVNDNKIEGSKTVENMGNNSFGQPYYNVQVNGHVTLSTGEIIDYTSSRVRIFTHGYTTYYNFWDDEYDITGTANATISGGDGYSLTVTSPLHVKIGCGYITQGKLNFTPVGKPVRMVDYGNGNCDATFTVTINGQTYTVN